MITATALLFTAFCATAVQGLPSAADSATTTTERQQAASGLVIAADIEGRLAIYDGDRQLVTELDKPAGRQLRLALEPGVYEARLDRLGAARARFMISEGHQLVLTMANFREPASPAAPPAHEMHGHAGAPHHQRALDGRHRIEMRFGGWGDGGYSHDGHADYWGSGQATFGIEYLNFVRNDLGIGLAINGLARGEGGSNGWDGSGSGQAVCSLPVTVRWYPLRRVTRSRGIEPYFTGGLGPVFAANAIHAYDGDPYHWDNGHVSAAHVETAFGGRIGGGVDLRLGSTFTLGMAGAWNWDTGFSDMVWHGLQPGGGEFSVTLGWNFGR